MGAQWPVTSHTETLPRAQYRYNLLQRLSSPCAPSPTLTTNFSTTVESSPKGLLLYTSLGLKLIEVMPRKKRLQLYLGRLREGEPSYHLVLASDTSLFFFCVQDQNMSEKDAAGGQAPGEAGDIKFLSLA